MNAQKPPAYMTQTASDHIGIYLAQQLAHMLSSLALPVPVRPQIVMPGKRCLTPERAKAARAHGADGL